MKKILLTSILALGVGVSAQVTGVKTIGTDYATLADAFTDLNTQGVGSGGVTLNIPAGYTETAPVGGYSLGTTALNATLSAANPLVITKTGSGSNPIFSAQAGTFTAASTIPANGASDAIFKFLGTDYVTIDGLTIQESSSNTTLATAMESGIQFLNLSATDGCQYNTVKNSTVKLKYVATLANVGILFAHTANSATAISPTSVEGTHSYNKIYSNTFDTIDHSAIRILGFVSTTFYDRNNDIGGSSASTGNTATNINTGNGWTNGTAVYGSSQSNFNVSYNNFTANSNFGVFLAPGGAYSSSTVNNNNITVTSGYHSAAAALPAGIFSYYLTANTGAFVANNNIISISSSAAGAVQPSYGIFTDSTGSTDITGNTISGTTYYGFRGINASSTAAVNITDNSITNNTTFAATTSSLSYNSMGIYLTATGSTTNILRNKIYGLSTVGASNATHGIYVAANTTNSTVNIVNNIIGDLKATAANATTVSLSGIYLAAASNNTNYNLYYNSIYLNGTSSGANFNSTGIYHANSATATVSQLDLRNNIITNLSTAKGTGYATALWRNAAALANYAATSNNNDFFVSSSATNNKIYYNGTTSYDFAGFQAAVTTREANSLNSNPSFLSIESSNANFLKVNPTGATTADLDNKGQVLAGYTTDYAGITRNTSTPDLGAYEFTYTAPTTVPSCVTLSPATGTTGVQPNPTTLSWNAITGVDGYKVYIGTTSGNYDIVNGTTTASTVYSLSLDKNKTYYAKVTAYNSVGDATGCSEVTFTTSDWVYCVGTGTTSTINPYLAINKVAFSDLSNTSSNASYEDFTTTVAAANVNRQGVYTFSITNGSAGAGFYTNDQAYVWIDYNNDGIFDNTTERTAITINAATSTASITIPATALLGTTRMRVRYSNSAGANYNTACGTALYGEVEDYIVKILPSCATVSSPANSATINATGSSQSVSIEWSAVTDANKYKLYVGTTAGGTDILNGTEVTGTSYTSTLNSNKTYYVRVHSVNNTTGLESSNCSDSSFSISEYLAVSDVNKTGISVYPNPFTDILKISDVKGVKSILVNDISGRQVKSLAPSAEINLSSLNTGVYIVNLQMEDGSVKTVKAIKK